MSEKSKYPAVKMNGIGNDFVVLDGRQNALAFTPEEIRTLADRENETTGGCDQLLIIRPPKKDGDVFMQIFNADGGEVGACGNGARAVAGYLHKYDNLQNATIETLGGVLRTERNGSDDFAVKMPPPKFGWRDIPLAKDIGDTSQVTLHPDLPPAFLVNVGNPHAVIFFENKNLDTLKAKAKKYGRDLEHHEKFPQRANINFSYAEQIQLTGIMLQTWERGVGLTKACGTGACATAIAAIKLFGNQAGRDINVAQRGGVIGIHWDGANDLVMHGEIEFERELEL